MKLSVVIPAYNEEENIKEAVLDVKLNFPEAEIIVVNDASKDKTLKILKSMRLKTLRILDNKQNLGHGGSVMRGLRAAKGDYILYIDADRQIGLQNYGMYDFLNYYTFISGYRYHRQDKLFRKVISFCLKSTIFLRYGFYIKDANCPFKIYKRSDLIPLLAIVPKTNIIPIACLEVLARKYKYDTVIIRTRHMKYHSERVGTLQTINLKSLKFFWSAFKEIIRL